MKFILKITSLLVVVVSIGCSNLKSVTKESDWNTQFIGTWQICNTDGVVDNNLYGRKDETSYKVFSSKDFSVFSIHLIDRKMLKGFLGFYSVDDKTITESIEYKSNGYPLISNQKYTYRYKIENDLLFIEGIDNNFKEVWKRIK